MEGQFVATINIPGYLPQDDEPPTFDTAQAAWEYLAHEREREEDWAVDDGTGEYSETVGYLLYAASDQCEPGSLHEDWPLNPDGTGVIYGPTPGYDGRHDLGLAYVVSRVH